MEKCDFIALKKKNQEKGASSEALCKRKIPDGHDYNKMISRSTKKQHSWLLAEVKIKRHLDKPQITVVSKKFMQPPGHHAMLTSLENLCLPS